jgi:5-methylcytosine-specific restriction protein A
VSLGDVTRAGVLAAVEEFDRRGRDAFLKSTGFGPARAYFLQHNGKLYDSKAIIGYAHGVSTGVPLRPGDFSGGDKTVAQRLETLGFEVLNLERPDWTRDEIIVACALAESNGWRQVYDTDERAKELSQLLQSPAIHPIPHHPDFRNPAGVGQKTRNIVDWHPDHRGSRSNGNHLDKEVLNDFLADRSGCAPWPNGSASCSQPVTLTVPNYQPWILSISPRGKAAWRFVLICAGSETRSFAAASSMTLNVVAFQSSVRRAISTSVRPTGRMA